MIDPETKDTAHFTHHPPHVDRDTNGAAPSRTTNDSACKTATLRRLRMVGLCWMLGWVQCIAHPEVRSGEIIGGITTAHTPGTEICPQQGALPTTGLYVVTELDQPVDEKALAQSAISGVTIRVGWRKLQPSARAPAFDHIDDQIALARRYQKKVALSIEAGLETPGWVYSLGARGLSILIDEADPAKACEPATVPVPWDPVYLDAFRQLIRATGRHYNQSGVLTHVKVTGIASVGPMVRLPHGPARRIVGRRRACTTSDASAQWSEVGYSRARVVTAFRELVELFSLQFSAHQLAVVIDTKGFPAIGEDGGVLSRQPFDTDIVPELINVILAHPTKRILIQENTLSAEAMYPFPIQLPDTSSLGFQFREAVTRVEHAESNKPGGQSVVPLFDEAIRRAVLFHARFVELHALDAANSQLTPSLAGARVLLRSGKRPL